MKKVLSLLVVVFAFASCADKSNLQVTLPNADYDGQMAYLYTTQGINSSFQVADSAVIKKDKFSFNRPEVDAPPTIAFVYIPKFGTESSNRIIFINEKGPIEIQVGKDNKDASAPMGTDNGNKVKGTPMNDAYQAFFDKNSAITQQLAALVGTTPDIEAKAEQLMTEQSKLIIDYLRPNIKNSVGEFFFISNYMMMDEAERNKLLDEADLEFKKMIEIMSQPMNTQESLEGRSFMDIKGKTPEGKSVSLSDYAGKGKIVLVDFWASWCGPCRQEMPMLVDLYAKYKSKGFEIVGVSLDDKSDNWKKGISDLNMTWPQMSDLKGWQSAAATTYKVTGIPYTVLIGKDGKIVAEFLRGQELLDKIDELLK